MTSHLVVDLEVGAGLDAELLEADLRGAGAPPGGDQDGVGAKLIAVDVHADLAAVASDLLGLGRGADFDAARLEPRENLLARELLDPG